MKREVEGTIKCHLCIISLSTHVFLTKWTEVMIDREPLAVPCPSLASRKMYFIKKKMKEYTFFVESDGKGIWDG
jgi:hypothetical protein